MRSTLPRTLSGSDRPRRPGTVRAVTTSQSTDDAVHEAQIDLHTEHRVAAIDERIFSGFLEHMGRAVYQGVFDPGSPLSDERGFRRDVIDALAPLRMPMVRYPGGNFVSSYDWRDGVGPRDQRPRRPDFAWRSIETNQFGTDEFMSWCQELGTEPMMAVNLGTAGRQASGGAPRVLQPADRHEHRRRARRQRPPRALRREAVVPGQRDGRALAGRARLRRDLCRTGRVPREPS